MKCTYCGYNLNIDDKFCTFCGKENTHAVQHRKDMQHYSDDYHRTKRIVFENSEKKVNIIAKVTIIVGLLLVFILTLYATRNAYRVRIWTDRIEIKKNLRSHRNNLDRLEEERDFFGLTAYFDEHELYLSPDLEEYRTVADLSENFLNIYKSTFNILNVNMNNMDEDSYESIERNAEYISDYIYWSYDRIQYSEYRPEQYTQPHMSAMEDLMAEQETFIQVYLNIPKKDIENFPELSAPKIQLIIERGIGYGED